MKHAIKGKRPVLVAVVCLFLLVVMLSRFQFKYLKKTWKRNKSKDSRTHIYKFTGPIPDPNIPIDTNILKSILKDEPPTSHVTVQILPTYTPDTYKSPIPVEWWDYANYAAKQAPDGWKRLWTAQDHSEQIELLRLVSELFSEHGIEFCIDYGSIIGSYRHFDFVPWDDDIDIMVHEGFKEKIIKIVETKRNDLGWSALGPIFKLFPAANWNEMSTSEQIRFPKYPFVDVFFFSSNATHVLQDFWGEPYDASMDDFFPLKLRPLGKYWFPVPKNPANVLDSFRFKNIRHICNSGYLNHRTNEQRQEMIVSCSELESFYPFTKEVLVYYEGKVQPVEMLTVSPKKLVYVLDYKSRPVSITVNRHKMILLIYLLLFS